MSLESLKLSDFSGGLNYVDSLMKLAPNECEFDTYNVELVEPRGELSLRRGVDDFATTVALPSTTTDAKRISNIKRWRFPGTAGDQVIMSNESGDIWTLEPNDPTGPLASLILNTNSEFDFIQAQDSTGVEHIWCLNGFTTPKKYNLNTLAFTDWVATTGTVPNKTSLRVWKNRMCIAGNRNVGLNGQRLYYSAINNPLSWPANNFIDIKSTDDELDEITALEVVGENLLVFKRNSVWLVFDPVGFENRRIADIGCAGNKAVARHASESGTENIEHVYFVAQQGIFSTDGDEVRYLSKQIERLFQDSSLETSATLWTARARTNLTMLHDGKLMFINWFAMGPLRLDTVFFMDTRYKRPDGQHPWFRHKAGISPVSAMVSLSYRRHTNAVPEKLGTIGVLDDNPFGGGPQRIADLFVDGSFQDNGVDYSGKYSTGYIEVTPDTEKMERIRRVNIHGNGEVSMTLIGDETDVFVGGLQTFALDRFIRYRPEVRGRFFQVVLNLLEMGRVSTIELMWRGGKEH